MSIYFKSAIISIDDGRLVVTVPAKWVDNCGFSFYDACGLVYIDCRLGGGPIMVLGDNGANILTTEPDVPWAVWDQRVSVRYGHTFA